MHLHWHRRDLRLADNRGLAAAPTAGETVPAFVLDPGVLDHAAPPRVSFMLDALSSLRDAYHERGSDLLIARGDSREVLPALVVGITERRECIEHEQIGRASCRERVSSPV